MLNEKYMQIIFGEIELSGETKKILSFMFIILAIVLAWLPKERALFWRFTLMEDGFYPNFITGAVGLMIVLPLYIRNIFKWRTTSVFSILAFLLNVTLVSTFVKIIMGGSEFQFTLITTALIVAVIITWLGMRPIVPLAWAAVFGLGALSLVENSYMMGVSGYLFIVFGFLGVLLHSELDIATLSNEVMDQFKGPVETLTEAGNNIV